MAWANEVEGLVGFTARGGSSPLERTKFVRTPTVAPIRGSGWSPRPCRFRLSAVAPHPFVLGLVDRVLERLGFAGYGCPSQLLAEDHVERLRQLAGDATVLIEDQSLEECEVELPPHPVCGFVIGRLAVAGSGQGTVQIRFGRLEVSGDGCQSALALAIAVVIRPCSLLTSSSGIASA
jgi:hypothetical protein